MIAPFFFPITCNLRIVSGKSLYHHHFQFWRQVLKPTLPESSFQNIPSTALYLLHLLWNNHSSSSLPNWVHFSMNIHFFILLLFSVIITMMQYQDVKKWRKPECTHTNLVQHRQEHSIREIRVLMHWIRQQRTVNLKKIDTDTEIESELWIA